MRQKSYNTVGSLVGAGEKISAAAATYAAVLNLVVATKVLVDADVSALTTATGAHLSAKGALRDRLDDLNIAARDGREKALLTRDLLRRTLGQKYPPAWNGTGFNGSL